MEKATAIEDVCSLPGVICFIDVSHIRLATALGGEQDYYILQTGKDTLHAIAWYISFTLNDLVL